MSSTRQKREKKKREKERKRRAQMRAGNMPIVHLHSMPPGVEKMSDVFCEFLEPYWHLWETEDQLHKLLTLGMAAWNAAIVTGEKRENLIRGLEELLPPEARAEFRSSLEDMCRHKRLRYPDNKRLILQYRFRDEGDTINLQVVSTASQDL
jgi:hypothetical protein